MSSPDVATIVGYVLFAISEILPFLPIHANGFFESVIIGLKNGFNNRDADVELAQQLISKKPTVANVVNTMSTNPVIQNCFKNILENQNIIPFIETLCNSPELQNLFHSMNSNPVLLNNVKNIILTNQTQQLQHTFNTFNPNIVNPNTFNNTVNTRNSNPNLTTNNSNENSNTNSNTNSNGNIILSMP